MKELKLEPEHIYTAIPDLKKGDVLKIKIPKDASKLVHTDAVYFEVSEIIPGSSAALRQFLEWTRETAVKGYLVDKNGNRHIPAVLKVHYTPINDDLRRLLLAGVELYSVERNLGRHTRIREGLLGVWDRIVLATTPKTMVRASIQIYVPEGDFSTFLGELARTGAIPLMLKRFLIRIGDQTPENVRLVSTDGQTMPRETVLEKELVTLLAHKPEEMLNLLSTAAKMGDTKLRKQWENLNNKELLRKLADLPVSTLNKYGSYVIDPLIGAIDILPEYLLETEKSLEGMKHATTKYVNYLLKHTNLERIKPNISRKLKTIERLPRVEGLRHSKVLNPNLRKITRKSEAELWNWLILHHEARMGAAKALLSTYLRALKEK